MTTALLLLLALQQQPATQAPPAKPPAATPAPARPPVTPQAPGQPGTAAPAPPRRPAVTTGTLAVRVVDRSGRPIEDAHVVVQGPATLEEKSDKSGNVTFKSVAPGSYRVRAEIPAFIALEKEIVVKAATAPQEVLLSLSAAPIAPAPEPKKEEPPPPPPPPPPPVAPLGTPGEPRILSIPDLAEHSLSGRDPLKVFPIGCSGLSQSRLIVLRDSLPAGTNKDADETLYLVAGEATLTLGGKEQAITPGWFSIVPRGTSYAISRKGRNPAILLSTVNGRPCDAATTHQ